MNTIYLIGNLGRDAEFKSDIGTGLLRFSVATSERYTKKDGSRAETTTWHNVVMWGPRGAELSKQLTKGRMVFVTGTVKTRQYEKDGQKRTSTEVDAKDIVPVFASKNAPADDEPAGPVTKAPAGSAIDDDDIPF